MAESLLPCPICGKKVELRIDPGELVYSSRVPVKLPHYFIECSCGIKFSIGPCYFRELVEAWNQRIR